MGIEDTFHDIEYHKWRTGLRKRRKGYSVKMPAVVKKGASHEGEERTYPSRSAHGGKQEQPDSHKEERARRQVERGER